MSTVPFSMSDLGAIAPEILITLGASLVLLYGAFDNPRQRPGRFAWITFATIALAASALVVQAPDLSLGGSVFSGLLATDSFGVFFSGLFLLAAALAVGTSIRFLDDQQAHQPEFYFFLLTALLGMLVMARSIDFVTIFVGLELQALSIYVLVGYLKADRKSNEGGLKYFILGGFSSGIFLYAISLLYALTGTTRLQGIREAIVSDGLQEQPVMIAALVLMAAALGFKVAAVPFHVWAPDAYTGGPTPVSLFITVASKAAAFAVLLRVFLVAMAPMQESWSLLLAVLSLATMSFGNIAALTQDNIKRMLAYSSIAHAGYAMMGVVAAANVDHDAAAFAVAATLFYLLAYTFMNIGAWATVALLRRQGLAGENLDDYAGLASRSYWAFSAMLLYLLSLGGIPPTGGFLGKWYVFSATIQSGWGWLAVAGVINTAISLYYYLRIVVVMCMRDAPDDVELVRSTPLTLTLVAAAIMTLLVGIWASPFLAWVQSATLPLS
ncbi:MAG: NADH-quinone oxidoreductase subunit N [Acidobacteriota bacterium]